MLYKIQRGTAEPSMPLIYLLIAYHDFNHVSANLHHPVKLFCSPILHPISIHCYDQKCIYRFSGTL